MYPISGAGGERVRRRDSGRRESDRRGQCQGVPAAKKGPDGWRVCQSVVRVWEGGRAVGFICMAFVSFVYRLVELVVAKNSNTFIFSPSRSSSRGVVGSSSSSSSSVHRLDRP
jgi:hypothetical protein